MTVPDRAVVRRRSSALLRASVAIFLGWGVMMALGGGLGAGIVARVMRERFIFMSSPADAVFFGRPIQELYATDPALRDAAGIYMTMISAVLGAMGIAVATAAWCGLRRRSRAALVGLTITPAPIVAWFLIVRSSYVARDATITLRDVPPFVWLAALVAIVGGTLGWLALRRSEET